MMDRHAARCIPRPTGRLSGARGQGVGARDGSPCGALHTATYRPHFKGQATARRPCAGILPQKPIRCQRRQPLVLTCAVPAVQTAGIYRVPAPATCPVPGAIAPGVSARRPCTGRCSTEARRRAILPWPLAPNPWPLRRRRNWRGGVAAIAPQCYRQLHIAHCRRRYIALKTIWCTSIPRAFHRNSKSVLTSAISAMPSGNGVYSVGSLSNIRSQSS